MQDFLFIVFIALGCVNGIGYTLSEYSVRSYQGWQYTAILYFLLALCCK